MKNDPAVWLTSDTDVWERLPGLLKGRLCDSMGTISGLRRTIASGAKVQSMPPVEIAAELWFDDAVVVEAEATTVSLFFSTPAYLAYGVRMPAQTALIAQSTTIRKVLIHEFMHCFWLMERSLMADDLWPESLTDTHDPYSDEDDRAGMVHPDEWLGATDAAAMTYHGQRDVTSEFQEFLRSLADYFPRRLPESRKSDYTPGQLYVPAEIIAHVRKLQQRSKPPA